MNGQKLPRNDLGNSATKPNAKIFSEFLKMIVVGAELRLVALFNTRLLFRDSYSYSNTPLGFWASTPFHSVSAYALTINNQLSYLYISIRCTPYSTCVLSQPDWSIPTSPILYIWFTFGFLPAKVVNSS
jgi:hypothetical protein